MNALAVVGLGVGVLVGGVLLLIAVAYLAPALAVLGFGGLLAAFVVGIGTTVLSGQPPQWVWVLLMSSGAAALVGALFGSEEGDW